MGKRKSTPRRNPNATVIEAAVPPSNRIKKRIRKNHSDDNEEDEQLFLESSAGTARNIQLLEDDESDQDYDTARNEIGKKRRLQITEEEDDINSDSESQDEPTTKPAKEVISADVISSDGEEDSTGNDNIEMESARVPLHTLVKESLLEIFLNSTEEKSKETRQLSNEDLLKPLLEFAIFTKEEFKGSVEDILPAILDFGMLSVDLTRLSDGTIPSVEEVPNGYCIRQFALPVLEENPESDEFLYSLSISITNEAFQLAAPDQVSTYLLGTNAVRRRKNRAILATLALRRALACLFPQSLIEAIYSNPSGKDSDPIQASFVYRLVDNLRFQERYFKHDKEPSAPLPPTKVDGLLPELRQYQSFAVEWMLRREQKKPSLEDDGIWQVCWLVFSQGDITSLPRFLDEYNVRRKTIETDSSLILLNPFTGALCMNIDEARIGTVGKEYNGVRGGILAESMGLGKTVEVLACILSHKRQPENVTTVSLEGATSADLHATSAVAPTPTDGHACVVCSRYTKRPLGWVQCSGCKEHMHTDCAGYGTATAVPVSRQCPPTRCPCCSAQIYASNPIKSRGTLIVTPPAILEQWAREIRRHSSRSLKVVIYHGIKKLSNNSSAVRIEERLLVHPHVLADADIVLTTFPVLNSELAHSDNQFLKDGISFRARKRYRVVPSPLNSIEWWRVCLDEAQRVEGTAAAAAQMALRLQAKQRWCVTGTPIGRGKLDDLYGLLLFVGVMPFQFKDSFRHCHHNFRPGLEERIRHMLRQIFWRSTKSHPRICEQLGIPEQIERKVVLDFSSIERHFYKQQLENTLLVVTEGKKGKRGIEQVSNRLHSLRAACCHPQVGASGIMRLGPKSSQGISSRVLSMQQVLDKIIDDARNKCEESQRIAILNTNALACISKLKVELKQWDDPPVAIEESDEALLNDSARSYLEALQLTDDNATPSDIIGEAQLSGCDSFLCDGHIIRDGEATLKWRSTGPNKEPSTWARVEFRAGKKLTAFKVRPVQGIQGSVSPRDCALQVSLASLGGAFVDVRRFTLAKESSDWLSFEGIRTNRSKTWRILVETTYSQESALENFQDDDLLMGLECHFMEPSVGSDDLQRMHILHNSATVVDSLIQLRKATTTTESTETLDSLKDKLTKVNTELTTLETNYLGYAKSNHRTSQLHLKRVITQKSEMEQELCRLSKIGKQRQPLWKEKWWQDLLSFLVVDQNNRRVPATAKENLCTMVQNDLYELFNGDFSSSQSGFPPFESLVGLQVALKSRFERDYIDRLWMKQVQDLSEDPTMGEIMENSTCRKCRADWFQTGPKCRHCELEETILEYEKSVTDRVPFTILQSISRWLSDAQSRYQFGHGEVYDALVSYQDQAAAYFKLIESEKKEITVVKRHWRIHFDMLSDYDELNACKSTMRLPRIGENLATLPQQELDRIVVPRDIAGLVMKHKAKQASSLGALRRDIASLRYLKNQSKEQRRAEKEKEKPTCPVCLMEFGVVDRAVLKCGHSLHIKCIDEILKRSAGSTTIRCPMKCLTTTSKQDVLIAAEDSLQNASGTVVNKKIEGSWGTKVDRLVADIIDVINQGERCLVFSQWDDLLSIVESALFANNIAFTHPKGSKMFGAGAQALRSTCQVMLLNVKSGAEGLTLVEATHVFMIEPLLHCGLDAQAINRVHRIGQTSKTYVHRYIIKQTIEEKIDAIRMDRQATSEDDGDSATMFNPKSTKDQINAGGLDGGFTSEELKDILTAL